jgi:hypothetical protein
MNACSTNLSVGCELCLQSMDVRQDIVPLPHPAQSIV